MCKLFIKIIEFNLHFFPLYFLPDLVVVVVVVVFTVVYVVCVFSGCNYAVFGPWAVELISHCGTIKLGMD